MNGAFFITFTAMKRIATILFLLITVDVLAFWSPIETAFEVDGIYYYYLTAANDKAEAQVTYGDNEYYYKGHVTVPAEIEHDGEKSTIAGVAYWAFMSSYYLESVDFEGEIGYFGDAAFAYCFNLSEIEIPEGITYIGDDCFAYCYSLREVTIPGTTDYFGPAAFFDCINLERVTIEEGVEAIPFEAFECCLSLEEVTIPSTVTYIDEGAFYCCGRLKKIIIYAEEPPVLDYNVFSPFWGLDEDCVLIVPDGYSEVYAESEWAEWFKEIIEISQVEEEDDVADSIKSIEKDVYIVGYYNLLGQKFDSPQNGMNIVIYSDGTTKKILVK